ncbi:MFS transporter [Candidatus Bathyarchaeota archaeon]|nr:MFS transporter [Candidatus Bathyarchaeota archaeon]
MIVDEKKSLLPFTFIYIGQAFSLFGSTLVQFSLVWYLTRSTGSASVLAIGTIMAMLPNIVLAPIAGAYVDRWSRKWVLIISDALTAFSVLILAILFTLNSVTVWHIYFLMLFRSLMGVFHSTAFQASTSLMVPDKHLARVGGLNQALVGFMNILAFPIGAILMDMLPLYGILSIDVATAIIAILPIFILGVPQPKENLIQKKSLVIELKEGFHFLMDLPHGKFLFLGIMIVNFLVTPAVTLIPLYITQYFKGGAIEYAWAESVFGIGLIIGGITLTLWGGFKRRMLTTMLSFLVGGITLTLIGLLPPNGYRTLLIYCFILGFIIPIGGSSFFAMIQSLSPPELHGRIISMVNAASAAMSPLGLALAGPITDMMGPQIWFITGGITMSSLSAIAITIREIINIEETMNNKNNNSRVSEI